MQVCLDLGTWKGIEFLGWNKFLQILDLFQIEKFYSLTKIRLILHYFNGKSAHDIFVMHAVIVAVLLKIIEIIFGEYCNTIIL